MKIRQEILVFLYGYRCNYSCDQCLSAPNVIFDSRWDPDMDALKRSILRSAELFEVTGMVTLSGGEPFLYWEDRIRPLSLEINQYFPGVRINIPTNGQLLSKNLDKVLALANEVEQFSLSITRHLNGVDDEVSVKQNWLKSVSVLDSHPMIVKLNSDHYHIRDNIRSNIYFYETETWKHYYRRAPNGQIKPFATNDPQGSMAHGCTGSVCSSIVDNKLYKCTSLATLGHHLRTIGQQDDPDWFKYINYPAIDLDNIDEKTWSALCSNLRIADHLL
jgi:organic radical activating enzyme